MSEENKNKNDKEFSFIQEQIASKKKGKLKRMLYSVAWTIILACIFGLVAGVAFCVSEPTISKLLGKEQDKKTVQFPSTTPEATNTSEQALLSPTPIITNTLEDQSSDSVSTGEDNSDCQDDQQDEEDSQPETLVIEQTIKADLTDLASIYTELRVIANDVNNSIVKITSINSGVDYFKDNFEEIKKTTGLVVANNEADLLILVSWDKIKDANDIQVTFPGDLQIDARLQDYDSDLNLAVIAVNLEDIPQGNLNNIKPATLGESYSLTVGSPIMALGSPNGYVDSMEIGIITSKGSSVYVTDNIIDLFNTDIDFNDDGDGVVVNLEGEVMGIITHKLKDDLNKDVNTVIGISSIRKIIESLVNHTDRIYFGIKGADMTDKALAKAETPSGICVTEVEADSPALAGGLQSGDIITSMNDIPIMSMSTFHNLVSSSLPKATLKITIKRSSKNTYKDMDINVIVVKKSD